MDKPLRVTLVKPHRGLAEHVGRLVGTTAAVPLKWWAIMLLLGAAHHDIDSRIPALGYWQTAVITVLISLLVKRVPNTWDYIAGAREKTL